MAAKVVLLVDDDKNSALFVRFAFKHMDCPPALQYVPNALEAIQYLTGQGRFANRALYPIPDLLLLDLKMPSMDGFEFLEWLGSQADFSHLPVVILTGSIYQPDADRALSLGADGFLIKTVELLDLRESLKQTLARFFRRADPIPA
jgi:CheY-like chemotaxis protein